MLGSCVLCECKSRASARLNNAKRRNKKAKQDREYYLSTYAKADTKKTYADVFLPGVERSVERHLRQKRYGQDDRFKILKKRDPSDDRYHYTTIKAGQKLRCIAVFDKLDPNANSIRIDVYGLSNDIREIKQDDGTLLIEERVRVLTFKRLGDEFQIDQDSFKSLRKEWTKKSVKLK